MQLRHRVATLALIPLGIALSGCSSRHVFHVDNSRLTRTYHVAPRSRPQAKKAPTQANVKAQPAPAPASTWAGELD